MKTPRELLLQRHHSAVPRLDAIRRNAIAELTPATDRNSERRSAAGFLAEFLLPLRWHVAAMSTLWLLAILLNTDGTPAGSPTHEGAPSSHQLRVALFENRRQLAELINAPPADEPQTPSPVPQPVEPRRRSGLQPSFVVV